MTLRDSLLAAENNFILNLGIEGDSKMVIDYYNKRSNVRHSIMLLMKDIWKLTQDLNIYYCFHIYREAN